MSHTPGPWNYHYDVIYSASTERNICELYAHRFGSAHSILDELDKEDEATRALIVAAPDLLEACKAALKLLSDFGFYGYPADGVVGQIKAQLHAAIVKAGAHEPL